MTENNEKITTHDDKQPMVIHAQFVRDLSFEAPNSPQIFNEMRKMPDVNINVDVQAGKIEENVYGVDLKFHINGKIGDKVAFIAELAYGCIVTLNVEPEHVQPMLLIEVPRHIFPFARNIIADLTREGGFPPLMITPIDFVSLYKQRMQEATENQAPAETTESEEKRVLN